MNFGDFTDGGNPGASDYIAGYRAGGGSGSDRRWLRSTFANPPSDDGLALGNSSTLRWSDLNLASGGVIDWNSSNVTMTHSSGALDIAGATVNIFKTSGTPATSGTTTTALFRLSSPATNNILDVGIYSASPQPVWLQGTNRADLAGIATPISINPNGGQLLLNTSLSGIADSNSNGFQIGDNWTTSATYYPGGSSQFGQINLFNTALNMGVNCWVRTSTLSGPGLAVTAYAFADNATSTGAWPFYSEAHRLTQNDFAGSEFAAVNRYNEVNACTPYGLTNPAHGGASCIQLEAGNDVSISRYTQYTSAFAIRIISNHNADQVNAHGFANGIVFSTNSLDSTINPISPAISFPSSATEKYALAWYTSQSHVLWNIYSSGTSTVASQSLELTNTQSIFSAAIKTTDTTATTSTSTGSLIAAGGIGVAETVYIGGKSGASDTGSIFLAMGSEGNVRTYSNSDVGVIGYYFGTNYPSASTFQRVLDISAGGGSAGSNIRFLTQGGSTGSTARMTIDLSGQVVVTANTVPSSTTTGAFVVTGGVGIGGSGYLGGDFFLASGKKIDFNAGDVTLTHSTDTLTVAGGSIKLAAGTTALAPLLFQAGTNLTSAADGAMEFDGQALFFSPDASDRRIIPTVAICRLHAAYTLADSTTLQKLFNASTNGTLTLPVGSYIFEALVGIDAMSASGGNAALAIKAAGGATITNILQYVVGIDGAKATAGAASGASWSATDDAPAANTSVVTAGTATEMAIMWKGSFEITGAGTIIPSVDLITGGVTPAVKLGSYFMCWRMGAATDVTQGNWS